MPSGDQIFMAKFDLTVPEQQIIGDVLKAFTSGRFIPDDLMPTLLGYSIQDIQELCRIWGMIHRSELNDEQIWLVGAVFNALCVYPHNKWGLWYRYVHASPQRTGRIFDKWNYLTQLEESS